MDLIVTGAMGTCPYRDRSSICVCITGWNEWIAIASAQSLTISTLPVMFVDEFDWEHSRDIEPCAGGTSGGFPEGMFEE